MSLELKRKFASFCIFGCLAIANPQGMAIAQEVDCSDPQDQSTMNQCAYLDWQAADAELNKVWKEIRAKMRETDDYLPEEDRGAENALLKSQRAWIEYRDGTCEAEGFQVRGGSLEPLFYNGCLARLTRHRTKELSQIPGDFR